jgi:hypothetical protein
VSLELLRLLNQHDRHIIFNGIPQPALVALQRALFGVVYQLSLARGTDKYFQQFVVKHQVFGSG